jgi:formylglycine-generating enzyme required for sulfatase activity
MQGNTVSAGGNIMHAISQFAKSMTLARQLLEDAREYAGLLLERGPGEYGFIHLTFQEYLAAAAIAQQGQQSIQPVVETLAAHVGDDNWHEVSLLTIGYLGIVQQRDEAAEAVLKELIRLAPGEPGQAVVLGGEAVIDSWPGGVTPDCWAAVAKKLQETMGDDLRVKPPLRAAAGNALARLGDSRFPAGAWFLPDEPLPGFVEIPTGSFHMGSDKRRDRQADNDESPQHEVSLPQYYIARYPVTNAQFSAFVEDGGYREQSYWREAKAAGWWDASSGRFKGRLDDEPRDRPYDFGEPFNLSNHPVVGVSWYEALAFTRWLTERLRTWPGTPDTLARLLRDEKWSVTLPSEAQWEKAARGEDGRLFPWGNERDPNRANYSDTGVGATSAVGCFPGGISPCGCEEMSGNVWEWCLTKWEDSYKKYKGDNSLEGDVPRVLRGGAFYNFERDVRCVFREGDDPDLRGSLIGFRVVVSPL